MNNELTELTELTDPQRATMWAYALFRLLEEVEHGSHSDSWRLSALKLAIDQADLVKRYVGRMLEA